MIEEMIFLKFNVIITLFPRKAGGRMSCVKNEYSPNAVFGFNLIDLDEIWNENYYHYTERDNNDTKNFGVKLKFIGKKIYPGEVSKAELELSETAVNYVGDFLLSGNTFILREGGRVIGSGLLL